MEGSALKKVFETVYGKKYSYPYIFKKGHLQDSLLLFACKQSSSDDTFQVSIARTYPYWTPPTLCNTW